MNELLIEKLKQLNNDRLMLDAIKFIISERIEKEKPIIEAINDDQVIGQKYRAYFEAKKLFEQILIDIDAFRDIKVGSDKFNKGK